VTEKMVFARFECCRRDLALEWSKAFNSLAPALKASFNSDAGLQIKEEHQYSERAATEIIQQKAVPNGPAMALRALCHDPQRGGQKLVWLVGAKFSRSPSAVSRIETSKEVSRPDDRAWIETNQRLNEKLTEELRRGFRSVAESEA
jgi:hypothetical protein